MTDVRMSRSWIGLPILVGLWVVGLWVVGCGGPAGDVSEASTDEVASVSQALSTAPPCVAECEEARDQVFCTERHCPREGLAFFGYTLAEQNYDWCGTTSAASCPANRPGGCLCCPEGHCPNFVTGKCEMCPGSSQCDAVTAICINCSGGRTPCNGRCVRLSSDRNNCGACGVRCKTNEYCSSGSCRRCAHPKRVCSNRCIDVSFDERNCGRCGNRCSGGQVCDYGRCVGGGINPR